jgi:hypothetical protein
LDSSECGSIRLILSKPSIKEPEADIERKCDEAEEHQQDAHDECDHLAAL